MAGDAVDMVLVSADLHHVTSSAGRLGIFRLSLSLSLTDVMATHTLEIQTPMSRSSTGVSHFYLNRSDSSPFVPHIGEHIHFLLWLLLCFS